VDLVNDHAFEVGEEFLRMVGRDEQGQLFRRCQQHVRRGLPLALAHMGRRVAGARLDTQAEAHLLDRHHEVALHIRRQRLQRRDVERVQRRDAGILARALLAELDQAAEEAGQRLAAARRRDQQGAVAGQRRLRQGQLVRPRRPAARAEPACEGLGQGKCGGMARCLAWLQIKLPQDTAFAGFFPVTFRQSAAPPPQLMETRCNLPACACP
jgi:hypothetical protein